MSSDREVMVRRIIEAKVTAAWLETCDDDGTSDEWMPGHVLPIGEVREVELEVAPLWKTATGWANWHTDGEQGWEWSDPFEECEIVIVTGSHSYPPRVPDQVVAYVLDPNPEELLSSGTVEVAE